jgi:hypothetical protein
MYYVRDCAHAVTALTADQVANWLLSSSRSRESENGATYIAKKLSQASPKAVVASPDKDVPDVPE